MDHTLWWHCVIFQFCFLPFFYLFNKQSLHIRTVWHADAIDKKMQLLPLWGSYSALKERQSQSYYMRSDTKHFLGDHGSSEAEHLSQTAASFFKWLLYKLTPQWLNLCKYVRLFFLVMTSFINKMIFWTVFKQRHFI